MSLTTLSLEQTPDFLLEIGRDRQSMFNKIDLL
jgi:hypothetical protein